MAYAFSQVGRGQDQDTVGFVSGTDAQSIDVETARAMFDEVIEALSLAGEDTSNIVFGEGYGYDRNGVTDSTKDFNRFRRAAKQVPGSYNPRTGEITIYRNAFSTRLGPYQTASGELGWQTFSAEAGFQSGLFITGHELGHRINNHNWNTNRNEFQANRYARQVYDRVCQGNPRC